MNELRIVRPPKNSNASVKFSQRISDGMSFGGYALTSGAVISADENR